MPFSTLMPFSAASPFPLSWRATSYHNGMEHGCPVEHKTIEGMDWQRKVVTGGKLLLSN
jgi:hypothetical protein